MVPVPGGEVWAEDTGGDGTPMVFIHAGWATSDSWSPLMRLLAGRYRMIRYDQRGFGRSPAPAAAFTALGDLQSVLAHARVMQAVVVGHSGGGGIALELALAEPERVASLVLVAPGTGDQPWPEDDPYLGEFARLFEAGDRDGLVNLGLTTWAPAGDDAAVTAEIRAAVSAVFADGGLQQAGPVTYDRLGEVRVPAVMVRGDREYPMVAAGADAIASRIPGCRRIVVSGADHMLPLRVPDRLAEIILGQDAESAE
ncbi:MAG: alpha/beta fold hydrolase [Streptosporangiaceae bacterium]